MPCTAEQTARTVAESMVSGNHMSDQPSSLLVTVVSARYHYSPSLLQSPGPGLLTPYRRYVISLVSRVAHPCPFSSVIDAKVDGEIQLS